MSALGASLGVFILSCAFRHIHSFQVSSKSVSALAAAVEHILLHRRITRWHNKSAYVFWFEWNTSRLCNSTGYQNTHLILRSGKGPQRELLPWNIETSPQVAGAAAMWLGAPHQDYPRKLCA